jgi:ligand-binding sensor domain-containing protein
MNAKRYLISVVLCSICSLITLVCAETPWQFEDFKDESVNTIITFSPSHGDNAVMVGTSTGIYLHEYGYSICVWKGLPVHDMKRIAYGKILAAAGNGSDSDGIYMGEIVAVAEPGTLWEFKLLKKINMPTAVAFKSQISGVCDGIIYVGNSSGVFTGQLCDKMVNNLKQLSSPSNPWSRCSALQFSSDGTFWAGGTFHDRVAFNIQDTALLLSGGSELRKVKSLDVVSMVNYSILNDSLLAIATYDSGIHVYKGTQLQWTIESPEKNTTIVAIAPFLQNGISGGWQSLVAASSSKVYLECLPESQRTWVPLGTPPSAELRCLAQAQDRVLWLGTSKGVYRYEPSTSVETKAALDACISIPVPTVSNGNGRLSFSVPTAMLGSSTLRIFDMLGKCVRIVTITDGNEAIRNLSSGIYRYCLIQNNRILVSGNVINP